MNDDRATHDHELHDDVHHDGGRDHHHGDDGHGYGHEHAGGVRGFLAGLFSPHGHDAADSIDDALTASADGIRAVKTSPVVLGVTALAQLAIVVVSGSVALFADTIHDCADALTAVPLWIAFVLGRRAATKRYTYGYGRAEDLADLSVVAVIALSAVVAGVEAVRRLLDPQPI